jgi:hypothetical protein
LAATVTESLAAAWAMAKDPRTTEVVRRNDFVFMTDLGLKVNQIPVQFFWDVAQT